MALFSLFKNQRGPRGFQLQHRYYDERKERLAQWSSNDPNTAEARRERIRQAWASKRTTQSTDRGRIVRLVAILGALMAVSAYLLR
ncbi:MAG: hypothetical protein ACO31C_00995 [Schleiferiaceae bacterium]|jgi:hypothetical protein